MHDVSLSMGLEPQSSIPYCFCLPRACMQARSAVRGQPLQWSRPQELGHHLIDRGMPCGGYRRQIFRGAAHKSLPSSGPPIKRTFKGLARKSLPSSGPPMKRKFDDGAVPAGLRLDLDLVDPLRDRTLDLPPPPWPRLSHGNPPADADTDDTEDTDDTDCEDAPCMECHDAKDGADGRQMILCDCPGCSNAAHLDCLGLRTVPAGDWFCSVCQQEAGALRRLVCKLCTEEPGIGLHCKQRWCAWHWSALPT